MILSVLLSVPIIVVIVAGSDAIFYYKLLRHGVTTSGTVTAKEPQNHATVRYSYYVNSEAYQGAGSAGFGTPSFEEISVGDEVLVVYMPNDPSVSCLGHPKGLLKDDLTFVGLAAIGTPVAIFFFLARWERRRHKKTTR